MDTIQRMDWPGAPRVAFVVVTKGLDYPTAEERRPSGARYTRDTIRGMLQFMGCKPRHAYKAAQFVFQKLECFAADGRKFSSGSRQLWGVGAHDEGSVYVAMPRSEFYELVCSTLTEYNYKYVPSSDEIKAACSLKERRRHIIVLLCGTSGSGKSTLASILASRLGISTVLSTDSVRHMMRGFTSSEETPLLFASTYEAGEALRKQQALDEARLQALLQQRRQQQQEQTGVHRAVEEQQSPPGDAASPALRLGDDCNGAAAAAAAAAPVATAVTVAMGPSPQVPSAHDLAIRGYKAQCELVSEQLEQLICGFEARRQSLVVEGVHLHVGLVMRLLQRHPGVVPFLVYIKNEGKHVERMAVRAKYMTLDPNKNKYVKNMRNIRWIQDYLFHKAEKHAIPCVENTNIDRSVGLIHLTLLGCLKRMMKGDQVLDTGSATLRMLHNEYTAVVESLAGMGAGWGPGTNCTPAAAAFAAAAAASAPSGAVATIVNVLGATQAIRESPSNLGPPPPPPPRMLGSPRVFSREIAAASLTAPGQASTVCGDGGDVYGEAALVAAVAVAAAASGSCSTQHTHSSSQLDLPVPYQNCAEAAALLLSSSPPHPHQQLHSVLLQARANRLSSCGAPVDLPLPSPPSPNSGPLLMTAALAPALVCPVSPKLRPGACTAARKPGMSPGVGSSSIQTPTPVSQKLLGSEVLDNITGSGEGQVPVPLRPPSATSLASNATPQAFTVVGEKGRGNNGGGAGLGVSPFCGNGPDLLQQQPPLRGATATPGGITPWPLVSGQNDPDMEPQLLLPQHATSNRQGQVLESGECGYSDAGPEYAVSLEQPRQQRLRRHSQGGQWRHLQDATRHDSRGPADRSLPLGDALYILPVSPVYSAQEALGATSVSSVACSSSMRDTAGHPGVSSDNGGQASTTAESAVAARSLPLAQGPFGIFIGECGGANDNDDKALLATLPLAVAPPSRLVAPCQVLSPEQQQHVEAVLPACMERLGAGSMRPQPLLAVGSSAAAGSADALVGHWLSQSVPSSILVRVEEGRETGEINNLCGTEGSAAAGHGSTSRAAVVVISTANGCADRAASAAFAAAKDAYTRFGDSCPEEVLRVVMESAILDEQMDGVTEQQLQQQSVQQQHVGSPAAPLSSVGAGVGFRQRCEEGQEEPCQGAVSHSRRTGEQQQQQHVIQAPAIASELVGMDVVASGSPSTAGALGGAGSSRRGDLGAAAMSAFAGPNAWSSSAAAALGAPVYLRTSSRCLGQESSSPSRCGYSSDEAGIMDGDAGRNGGDDGDGVIGDTGLTAGGGPGGSSGVQRRRRNVQAGSPGAQAPGDSDDPDGDGYGVYGMHGGASPLQEYGSVYESATHDDMDEHGDDEEGVPLGRSNTIIRHLAGALVRSRMRASASAAAGAASATGWPLTHAAAVHTQCVSGPPSAAPMGVAQRPGVSRKVPPGVAGVGSSPRQCIRSHPQHVHDHQQHQHSIPANAKGLSNLRADGPGGGGHAKQGTLPSPLAAGVDQQLRQLLRGGAAQRNRASGENIVQQSTVQELLQ
ncbi:hypothetical protein Vretimale_1911 [Volvox reticuliferus]|uniref:Uncharacterized protein n=1 Tax=Volvox reticuliferus TaxID=1737510 RepID=A0A8J4FUI1_9CHLO|nr:hypothetical protein Vretifemale_17353 [Volvox reticuliferus]GIL96000.1 hypothetical protein Vretimale_1911 [Volvox reticuliferus]